MGLGILLGGVLAEYSGFDATFWTMAFMQLAGTLLFLFFTKNFFLGRQLAGE
jgi:predicted MFS family arabinose efflux permease